MSRTIDTTGSKDAWLVTTNSDLTEGKGHRVFTSVCDIEASARRMALGRGVQGSDAHISKVKLYYIGNTLYGPINFEKPTKDDLDMQIRLQKYRDAKKKAESLGLSEEEINALMADIKPPLM